MRIVDPPYRTTRQLKNDPKLPLIAMSTFDHFAKVTLSSSMISLTIPLATKNSNHSRMALTSSNIASPKVHTSWSSPVSPEGLMLKEPVNGLYLKKFYA